MGRLKHRSLLTIVMGGLYAILFLAIGPCTRSLTQEEVNFLNSWADELPRYFGPGFLSQDQVRNENNKAEAELRDRLSQLNDRMSFNLPEDMKIDDTNQFPIMDYRIIRERYVEKIRSKLGEATEGDLPFPPEPAGNLRRDRIDRNLVQIYLLDRFVNTFTGFSFYDIRIGQGRPRKNQRVTCELIDRADEFPFTFNFTSSLEETLRWVDRLRNEEGFFYVSSLEIFPAEIPGAVRVNARIVSIDIKQKTKLAIRPLKLEDL